MTNERQQTSIKGLFQDLANKGAPGVLLGNVISEDPIKIQVASDAKLILTEASMIIPEHLRDHEREITLIDWKTENQAGGSGEAAFSSHNHDLTGRKKIIVHAGLKKGDQVHLLEHARGKQYFVLARA